MAYMSQENKAKIAPAVKAILAKYGMKGTLSVDNHSTLVLTLKSGKLDIIQNWFDIAKGARVGGYASVEHKPEYLYVNVYHIDSQFTGEVKDFLKEVHGAMSVGNHDNSDIQSDYFDVGWYVEIRAGKWRKPYILEA